MPAGAARREWVALALLRRRRNGARLRLALEELLEGTPSAAELAAFRRTWVSARGLTEADLVLRRVDAEGGVVLHPEHPGYPPGLRRLPDPPAALYARGDPSVLSQRCLAVVGSRLVRPWAETFASTLGCGTRRVGVTLLAGHTSSCEEAAAFAACATPGGGAVALVEPYGPSGGRLRDGVGAAVLRAGGLILSGLPPGTGRAPYAYALRNRLLGLLADDLVVVQAGEGSGALSAAEACGEAGGEVWVAEPPGDQVDPWGAGGQALRRQGARRLEHPLSMLWPGLVRPPWRPALIRRLERSGPRSPDGLLTDLPRSQKKMLGELTASGWLRWTGDGRLQPGYEPIYQAMRARHAKFL